MTNEHQSSAAPQPQPSASAATTGTLSLSTEPSPLAVTISDDNIKTVAQVVSPAQISLPAGLYMVRASRVNHPDLTQFAWVRAGSDRSIHLSEDAPTGFHGVTTAVSGLLDKYVRHIPVLESAPAVDEARPRHGEQEPFWIKFVRLKDWNSATRVELQAFSSRHEQTRTVLDITNPHQCLVFAQVARPGARTVNVAIPPAGALSPARSQLVVASETQLLQAHVRLATDWANSALQYMALGYYEEAKQLVEATHVRDDSRSQTAQAVQKVADWFVNPQRPTRLGRVIQRVIDRFEDPAAALVPRYLGLRTRDETVFNTLGDFMLDVIQGLSDGLVISAEIAVKENMYKTAAARILAIPPGGLPLFAEGFSMLVHRIAELTELDKNDVPADQLPGEEETKKLQDLLRILRKWAPFVNLNSPTLTFRGDDVTAPKEMELSITPAEVDGWIPVRAS